MRNGTIEEIDDTVEPAMDSVLNFGNVYHQTKENKTFIIEELNYPDNNQAIFNLLLKLQKKINCTGYALNVALEEIIGEKND